VYRRSTTVSIADRAPIDDIDGYLDPVLRPVTEGRSAGEADVDLLARALVMDPVSAAFATGGPADVAAVASAPADPERAGLEQADQRADLELTDLAAIVRERLRLLGDVWPSFGGWWRGYFGVDDAVPVPVVDLWRVYIPFAQWIVREKRRCRPDMPFLVGFNGSPGAGKTVLTNALALVANQLLDRDGEGQAIARSGDDWYLGKADREPLREKGYDPGVPGVSNRSLPGTHDLTWLRRNLEEMEHSTPDSVIRMGNFDKKSDDQPADPFMVRGRVGVFLFDLWFAGARTEVDPGAQPDGLRRRVAEHLRAWGPVFDRLDALWVFDWPSVPQMLAEREAQERLVERRRGTRGMSPEHIRAFMAYMIERAWDWETTSPIPPDPAVTFRARRDTNHRIIEIQKGGRPS
jgi:pantothenate kinase-related protein Tda10